MSWLFSVQKPSIYSQNDQGWRTYNISQLTSSQCEIADIACKKDAIYQRFQSIAIAIGGALIAGAMMVVAVSVANVVAAFFVLSLGKIQLIACYQFHEFTFFSVQILAKGVVYICTAFALKKLFSLTYASTQNHWNYAEHLDQQAVDALLHKAKLFGS